MEVDEYDDIGAGTIVREVVMETGDEGRTSPSSRGTWPSSILVYYSAHGSAFSSFPPRLVDPVVVSARGNAPWATPSPVSSTSAVSLSATPPTTPTPPSSPLLRRPRRRHTLPDAPRRRPIFMCSLPDSPCAASDGDDRGGGFSNAPAPNPRERDPVTPPPELALTSSGGLKRKSRVCSTRSRGCTIRSSVSPQATPPEVTKLREKAEARPPPANLRDCVDMLSSNIDAKFGDMDIVNVARRRGVAFSDPPWWAPGGYPPFCTSDK
uniref:Uncharacterized protein n=1 Tax=Ananas comosus var. bracteatus TaxID=296719 RepID=A0A6V7PYN5_ANACO|nr:unnamed protein product [Ananas comosus var. bracteatus]